MQITDQLNSQDYFFHAKKQGSSYVTDGESKCLLGHKLAGSEEGVFVEWAWDGCALNLKTDKYGFFPAYYWCSSDEFAVSNSISKLIQLGAGKKFDFESYAVFLRLGFYIEEDTPFKNIHALPPGTDLQWTDGKLNLRGDITVQSAVRIDRDEAIDQYIKLFRKSIQKRTAADGNFVVPISAGRDSRHILLELIHQGCKPKLCVTHEQYTGGSFKEDTLLAKQLCRELKLDHVVLDQTVSRYKAELRKNKHLDFCSDENQQAYVLAEYLEGKANTSYDGIAGDTLSEGKLRDFNCNELYRTESLDELAEKLYLKFCCPEEYLHQVLHKEFYDKISLDKAVRRLSRELNRHKNAPDPLASFYFYNRTRREVALIPYRVLGCIPIVFAPYLDYNLTEFLMSLPAEFLSDQKFHADTIFRAYPKYAHIPFEMDNDEERMRLKDLEAARFNRSIAFYYFKHYLKTGGIFNHKTFLPRMLACAASQKYASSLGWLPMDRFLGLMQMKREGCW